MKIELFPYVRPKGDRVLFLVSLRKVGSVTWVSPKDKDHPFDCVEGERSYHFLKHVYRGWSIISLSMFIEP